MVWLIILGINTISKDNEYYYYVLFALLTPAVFCRLRDVGFSVRKSALTIFIPGILFFLYFGLITLSGSDALPLTLVGESVFFVLALTIFICCFLPKNKLLRKK
jgi:hypothetical protein